MNIETAAEIKGSFNDLLLMNVPASPVDGSDFYSGADVALQVAAKEDELAAHIETFDAWNELYMYTLVPNSVRLRVHFFSSQILSQILSHVLSHGRVCVCCGRCSCGSSSSSTSMSSRRWAC